MMIITYKIAEISHSKVDDTKPKRERDEREVEKKEGGDLSDKEEIPTRQKLTTIIIGPNVKVE